MIIMIIITTTLNNIIIIIVSSSSGAGSGRLLGMGLVETLRTSPMGGSMLPTSNRKY